MLPVIGLSFSRRVGIGYRFVSGTSTGDGPHGGAFRSFLNLRGSDHSYCEIAGGHSTFAGWN